MLTHTASGRLAYFPAKSTKADDGLAILVTASGLEKQLGKLVRDAVIVHHPSSP